MPLFIGTRLGPYEIAGPLGTGGMGEVYRARDTRLGRDVALKILPPEVADDPTRRQRFELEARAVAALSHPNIVAVFDVGAEDGISYIVSELVDGESLRGAKFGLRKTLDIAVQIADGLAAAHDARIVHRDLKPDNILLTRDGRAKILDFGLAKVRPERPEQAAAAATETLALRTEPGVVMGTVGYMSPEQVRGLAVDHRSDIFSFGVILHELLTGQRAFRGETSVDIMQAILRQDPPPLLATVPQSVQQIVAHCLEKDPSNRFQSARDLSFALGALVQGSGPRSKVPAITHRSAWRRRILVGVASVAALALAITADRLLWWAPPQVSWSGTLLGGPEYAMRPRVSPDGHTLAFLAFVGELPQVAVMKPETGNWTVLTHKTERGQVVEISWSPDGTRIYYDRLTDIPQGIFSVPVFGGEEHLILPDAGNPEALPDGSLLVVRLNSERQTQVFRFWPETGQMQAFPIRTDWYGNHMRVFSDGRKAVVLGRYLGTGQPPGVHFFLVDLVSGNVRILQGPDRVTALAVTRDGKSVLAAVPSGNLHAVQALSTGGQTRPRTLFTTTNVTGGLDIGPDGSVFADQMERPTAVVRFAASGGPVQKLGDFIMLNEVYASFGALLADGRVLLAGTRQGRVCLMILEAGKEPVPMVNTPDETAPPAAELGPTEVAFTIGKRMEELAVANISTGTILRRITINKGPITALAATPNGKTLFLAAGGSIWSIPSTGGELRRIRPGHGVGIDPIGKYLLVQLVESTKIRLVRIPLEGGLEQEIPLSGPYRLTSVPIGSGMISKDGRLIAPLGSPDSWFLSPGIVDLVAGRMTRIRVDPFFDYTFMALGPGGQVTAIAMGLKSTLWKFQREGH